MKVLSALLLSAFVFGIALPNAQAQANLNPFELSQFDPKGGIGWNHGGTYNSKNNEYFAVWSYDTATDIAYVYGQRIDASTGAFRGSRITISTDNYSFAFHADAAYNSIKNEYLVVFTGNETGGYPKRFGHEIYAQRINADTGEKIGGNVRISDVGFETDPKEPGASMEAQDAAIVFNEKENHYLIVWWGSEVYEKGTPVPTWDFEWEVFGQFVSGDTLETVGVNDFRISTHGAPGKGGHTALFPYITQNTIDNQYLVTWAYNNYENNEFQETGIYGRRIDAKTQKLLDTQIRIDTTGFKYTPLSSPVFGAFNPVNDHYLVTWTQYDAGVTNDEKRGLEIYSQLIDGKTGAKVGERARLSETGGLNIRQGSIFGAAGYNSFRNQYIVVWDADPSDGLHYITGQAIDANTGRPVRNVDLRLSDVPALTSIPGQGMHVEPVLEMNTKQEGFYIGWIAWNLNRDATGLWGQLYDATSVDALNTQATPTPTPTTTPTKAPDMPDNPGDPTGSYKGDVKANIKKDKRIKSQYLASCAFNGDIRLPYALIVYRSADSKLDPKDKRVGYKTGSLTKGKPETLTVKAKPTLKASYLFAACTPMIQVADPQPKNNRKMAKVKL